LAFLQIKKIPPSGPVNQKGKLKNRGSVSGNNIGGTNDGNLLTMDY
jgi:hypothetical protein